jgi:RNA polymerase sigma-B factor
VTAVPEDPNRYAERDAMDAALIRLYSVTGDRRRLEKLVERFRPLVQTIALRYSRTGEPLEDVMQVGLLGLVKAIERYEPRPGSSFGAYARPTISGEIKRHFRDHTWAMKVPRSQKERWARIGEARREHPGASVARLGELLDLSVEEVREAIATENAYRTDSLDFRSGADDQVLSERLGRLDEGYDGVIDRDEIEDALAILGPRDRETVRLRYFDEALQREIGDRIGVSQMQVSRILNRSLEQMRTHLEPEGLESGDLGPDDATSGSSDDSAVSR